MRAIFVFTVSCLFLLGPFRLSAQYHPDIRISGFVKENDTGETLAGVSVVIAGTAQGTLTDNYGRYFLTAPYGKSISVRCSYVGFITVDTILTLVKDLSLDFSLSGVSLREVVIKADMGNLKHDVVQIPVERLKSIPMLMGQPDLIKALAFVPGVNTGVEGTTGLYVRGGAPDQNLILLDGATVYNATHLFGFQSVFDPEAIKDLKFIKGGFPARYGGRLSSIIDITMKEGNNKERHGGMTLGLINSGLMLEGPVKKNKSSFMVSGRAAYLGVLLLPTYFASRKKDDKPFNTMLSYDFNVKFNQELRNRDKFFVSFYAGQDNFITQYKLDNTVFSTNLGWGNKTASFRYIKSVSDRVFSTTQVCYNYYRLKEKYLQQAIGEGPAMEFLRQSEVEEMSLKQQFSAKIARFLLVTAGGELSKQQFKPSSIAFSTENLNTDSIAQQAEVFHPHSLAAFAEAEWSIAKWLTANTGIRYSRFQTQHTTYQYAEPRFNLTAKAGLWSVNLAYSRMGQFVHLLASNSLGLFSDLWVPSTDKVRPQLADQVSGGVIFSQSGGKIEIAMEGYYKKMSNQIDFRQGVNFFDNDNLNWQNIISLNGKGRAYGLEQMFRYTAPKFNGWISYTLSWSERQFDDINRGNWYPHHYDRRNNLSMTFDYALNKKWRAGTNFVYQTGSWLTLPSSIQSGATNTFTQPGLPVRPGLDGPVVWSDYVAERNNQRLPDYHRLDFSLTKSFLSKKHKRPSQLTFSIYNLYARKNPYVIHVSRSYQYRPDQDPLDIDIKWRASGRALFVLFPSISYHVKW